MNAISFEHVSKTYPKYRHILTDFKGFILRLPKTWQALRRDRFVVLDDVSFELAKGEAVGIIGANGAGKSTTLALIAGALRPDKGRIEVNGRIVPFLELGSGFHPELTGRENIILNGVLLGLTRREVARKFDGIVAFSGLESFLDQPVRTYSTGMMARLGFSVAAHLDPEILLIDEILAVGDLEFNSKCRQRILDFKRRGVTILLVSHSPDAVRALCDRVLWLRDGRICHQGEPGSVLEKYQAFAAQNQARGLSMGVE